jgi:NAD+ synthetase
MGYKKLTQKECATVVKNASRGLLNYCLNNGIHNVVTGVSGGLDSAVSLGIAQRAKKMAEKKNFELNLFGLIMPCESQLQAEILARQAIEKFEANEIKQDLTYAFKALKALMVDDLDNKLNRFLREPNNDRAIKIAYGNIKARLRMITCYHVAKKLNGLVLTNDNLSEYWMGFWTICGDVGDFGLIQHIMKGLELYDIARYLEVPQGIIDAKPDDGLGIAGGDEDQLGAPYPIVDRVMVYLIQSGFNPEGDKSELEHLPAIEGVDPKVVKNLAMRSLSTSFKRKGTVTLSREDLGLPAITDIKL